MIPVCTPTIKGNEKKYVNECLDTNWISSNGRFIKEFEEKFAEFCDTKHAVSCSSGTAALHLALSALGISEGDEVIIPNFTMIATANAVKYVGATPVFADSELDTWNVDPREIESKISPRTKAIIVVHTYGCPVDMDSICEIADNYNLYIVEDAAEAHGATYKGKKIGSLGDIAAFSFYGNKIITTGEGGMVTTNDTALAKKVASLRNHCFGEPRFIHHDLGFNYRMTNIQAAIGVAQLEKASELLEGRVVNAELYNERLKEVKGITLPPNCSYGKNVYWMYGILIDEKEFGMNKDQVMIGLKEYGVDTRSFFYPLHMQPLYRELHDGQSLLAYPNSEKLYREGLYLPSSSSLTIEEVEVVCLALKALSCRKK